jgi:tRNA dimethylallyltransferase
MDKLLVICGPTATGKTKTATLLAKKFNGELISADSRQVYRGMDIVTAKEIPDVPVWLYDVVNPDEEFSVSHWVKLAHHAIDDIQKRKKLPIVVGGTGLYIHALLHPLDSINIPPDKILRAELSELSKEQLQEMLQKLDLNIWNKLNNSDRNNPRRLIRKIEISQTKTDSNKLHRSFNYLMLGLTAPKALLDKLMDVRSKKRERQGIKKETEQLEKKYSSDLPSMSAIGLNEHAYARRQLTWFRKQPEIHWFDITKPGFERDMTAEVTKWYTGK